MLFRLEQSRQILTDRWRVLVCAVVEAGSGAMLRLRAMRVASNAAGVAASGN